MYASDYQLIYINNMGVNVINVLSANQVFNVVWKLTLDPEKKYYLPDNCYFLMYSNRSYYLYKIVNLKQIANEVIIELGTKLVEKDNY